MSNTSEPSELPENPFNVSVYGGKKDEVFESIERNLGRSDDSIMYHTWVNVSAMKRLQFLFLGGVESAMGIFDIIAMLIILCLVLLLFAFWQVAIYFLVIAILALFSGGAALKSIRGTFMATAPENVNFDGIENFVKENLLRGNFVKIDPGESDKDIGSLAKSSTRITRIFQIGIYQSLVIATLVLVIEVVYRYFTAEWLLDYIILGIFGLAFLIGTITLDLGVYLRYRLAKKLRTK
jgi:hypothetical protein